MHAKFIFAVILFSSLTASAAAQRAPDIIILPGYAPQAADQTLGMALMSAFVNEDGTLARGAGAVSSQRTAEGSYEVDLDRDIHNCTYTASVSRPEPNIICFGRYIWAAQVPQTTVCL
jgi:hypothetical protein